MRACSILLLSLLLAACQPAAAPTPQPTPTAPAVRRLTILYTNDEHGWITAQPPKDGKVLGGAAELLGRWRQTEGYTPDGPFLLLSGGDTWTGPAISSWFNGDSAAETLNLMGYRAAALGNHEFDFGAEVLARHAAASRFPYLSANLVLKSTGEPPDFVKPTALIEVAGMKVGLVGLTTLSAPNVTNPRHFAPFKVLPYADALAKYIPQLQAAGADLIVVLAHVCGAGMRALAAQAKALGADVLTAGHCHERLSEDAAGLPLIGGGQYLQSYARLTLDVDLATDAVVTWKADVVDNRGPAGAGTPDPAVAAQVAGWQAQADRALGEVIGYTAGGLPHRSDALLNLIMDAWLWAYGTADVAVNNRGGFRQGIDAGPITLDDVVGVLPFNNQLVDVSVTGAQLVQNLACCDSAVGGVAYRGGQWLLRDGTPVDPRKTYRVLINDFMADGGDSYKFGQQDPQAYFTAIDWRQPVIDYIRQWGTSQANPLEGRLDRTARSAP